MTFALGKRICTFFLEMSHWMKPRPVINSHCYLVEKTCAKFLKLFYITVLWQSQTFFTRKCTKLKTVNSLILVNKLEMISSIKHEASAFKILCNQFYSILDINAPGNSSAVVFQ